MKSKQNTLNASERPETGLSEEETMRLIREYESNPASAGRTQYLRYLRGEKLTYKQAVVAKCAECCNGYVDGRYDCEVPSCPLYNSMPYRGMHDAD